MKLAISVLILFMLAACSHRNKNDVVDPAVASNKLEEDHSVPMDEPKQNVDENLDDDLYGVNSGLNPVFFQYDDSQIEAEQVTVLENNAEALSHSSGSLFTIEGHCDERGTEEYNLALGDRRAKAAKDYLVSLGIDGKRIRTISYGESRPFASGHNEESWSSNRRAQFVTQ